MTDQPLSPATQAVMDAYYCGAPLTGRDRVAAALRAAADQANPKLHIEDIDYQHQSYVDGWKDSLELILAIAAELEALDD
jgi:hypothetical protein